MDDSSNDTWQDVISPPNFFIGDSGAELAMRESNSISTESEITNCPLCIYSPNIPGHTIEHYPVVQQLGLRLPGTNPHTNESSNPTTGSPPPPTTKTMRSPENSFECGSISRSIQRQVATMEQTMTHGMDELADNVSQVTDPIETSFDASTLSSPMPTGWKSGPMRSFDQHDDLCDKIDEMIKNLKTTGDAVSYAMFLIDHRIKYNEAAEEERVTKELLKINDTTSIKSELKTVPEDNPVKSPPSTTTCSPVIIKGVPLSKSSPIMVETVLSDGVSEVSLLPDALISQREEQANITQAVLDRFENLGKGTKIEDKSADMMTKLGISQTSAAFTAISADATDTAMGEWMDNNHAVLATACWDID